ncbi:diiron oxygenase [Pimelobacter simplex]|uniref:AurF N-oxygenase family protein n=1 Tax=Nocardioides simplex TaxID=2045 RepID=UPI00366CF16A
MSVVGMKQGVSQGDYQALLRTLSEASVEHHFDAFTDIAWDDPAYAIDPADPRWILPAVDPLGRTEWYRSLPRERQIEVGFYRQTNVVKVGLQFEQVLIAGLMMYCLDLPNGRAEFRYSTHEATEECHHTQMFQEFVNRTGLDVPGAHSLFRALGPFLPLAAKHLPFIFFIGVLGGEEPIDYVQKVMLRSGEELHPLLHRISQIHVAEEARHIGFAHQYLEHRAPRLNQLQRGFASVLTPVLMRVLCDAIVVPGPRAVRDMGIPKDVVREVWWGSPSSRKFLRDMFGDVRMLAEETGLMNPVSRRVWRALGIAGRPNRFRSEPASAAD